MARDTLTGSRIRERRLARGIKQAELAVAAEISAPYLNLIEHNRRRIGGALLNRIADALGVEAVLLSEGAQASLVTALQEAAAARPAVPAETTRAEELAGRFPGWAELLVDTAQQAATLQRGVEALTDRLQHDPQLAAALHEVLSTVTAIRSTAAILAEPGDIAPEWRDRFHRNLNEDAARLAQSSQSLVTYLEGTDSEGAQGAASPEEEVEQFHAGHGHHYPVLEVQEASEDAVETLLPDGLSAPARHVLARDLHHYLLAARALPLERLTDLVAEFGATPRALAEAAAVPVALVLRRLAAAPPGVLDVPCGLVIADAAGSFLYRKPLPDFPVPRYGTGCPLWPLYAVFGQPLSVIQTDVLLTGRAGGAATYRCTAAAEVSGSPTGRAPVVNSLMLIHAVSAPADKNQTIQEVGITCRICPAENCASRRAPAIQQAGF